MPQAGFEPAMLTSQQHHTDALDRANTGIRSIIINSLKQTVYCTHHLHLIQALCILVTDCVLASCASQNKLRHHSLMDL